MAKVSIACRRQADSGGTELAEKVLNLAYNHLFAEKHLYERGLGDDIY